MSTRSLLPPFAALLATAGIFAAVPAAQATYEGTAGRVFLTSDRDGGSDIWSMNADGSRPVRLTSSGDNLSPALSPDGTRVAFTSARDVWTMAIDGTDRVQVTSTAAVEESPTWSPDGARLAYVTSRAPDGGTDQEIVVTTAGGTGPVTQLTANTVPDTAPSWSPELEGRPVGMIAFVSARTGDTDRNVYVMEASGGAAVNVTPAGTYDGLPYQGHDGDPSWSPDGRIAYTHTFLPNAGGLPAVWVVDADGSGMRRVSTDPDVSASQPAWSPDGSEVAVVTAAGTDRNIALMSASGGAVRTIDATTSHDIAPDWQEDSVDPETLVLQAPSASTESTTAQVAFRSSEPGSDLECSLDGTSYTPCASPKVWTGLALGEHEVRMRAIDPVGRVDQTPATVRWTVVAPPPPTPAPPVPLPTPTEPAASVEVPPVIVIPQPVLVTPVVETEVARKVRLERSAGRVPVRMRVSPGDCDVVLRIRVRVGGRWSVVGSERTHVDAAGVVRTRVKVARKWRKRLDGHVVKARLEVGLTTASGLTTSGRERFVLRG